MSQQTMGIMKKCAPVFLMLQDERRQEIMKLLFEHTELGVTELTSRLSLSRPAVSHHLKLLLDAGLVTVRQAGKERYYRIHLHEALALLKQLTASLDDDLKEIKKGQ